MAIGVAQSISNSSENIEVNSFHEKGIADVGEMEDPPKSPLKRGTLSGFSPLKKGGWEGSPGLKTRPNPPCIRGELISLLIHGEGWGGVTVNCCKI
jgi:hypothetical protein